MASTLDSVLADVYFTLNILYAPTRADAEASYSHAVSASMGPNDPQSTDWVTQQAQQALLDTQYEVIKEICFNGRHPERGSYRKTSSALSSGSAVPASASDSTPFFGPFDHVRDADSGAYLTPRSRQVVQMALLNANNAFSTPYKPLVYCIDGATILHNTANVVLDGVGAVIAAYFALDPIQVKDYHRPALVAGTVLKMATKEGAWPDLLQQVGGLYAAHIAQIQGVGQQVVDPYPAEV